jgi:AhpD family alkylhydroperoxidase
MAHIEPRKREELAEFEVMFQAVEGVMGFVPNSYYTMGHRPEILRAFSRLAATVLSANGEISPDLKQLVALMASASAGCRYCQAHTASSAALAACMATGFGAAGGVWGVAACGGVTAAWLAFGVWHVSSSDDDFERLIRTINQVPIIGRKGSIAKAIVDGISSGLGSPSKSGR